MKKAIPLLMCCLLLLAGCKKATPEFETFDPTAYRILYQVMLDENAGAIRHNDTAITRSGVVIYSPLVGYYFPNDWHSKENGYFQQKEMLYTQMYASVIPLTDQDGSVHDYLCYHLYDNDLSCFFALYCDHNPDAKIKITWFEDMRGNRVIESFDTALVMEDYAAYWREVNEKYGVVPPLKETELDLVGKYPTYTTGDDARSLIPIVKGYYPDVKPYGTDYWVTK